STINEYKAFAYGAPNSSENVDNSDINDMKIESGISDSESPKVQNRGIMKTNVKKWAFKLNIIVGIHIWNMLINGQETVHWADDAYSRCPQKVIEFYES
ncbi:11864_t:CDS:2, partial [Dentiscutata heterogama]